MVDAEDQRVARGIWGHPLLVVPTTVYTSPLSMLKSAHKGAQGPTLLEIPRLPFPLALPADASRLLVRLLFIAGRSSCRPEDCEQLVMN